MQAHRKGNGQSFDAKAEAADSLEAIAVVGIGCWYPGASNPRALWQNILARRQQFRPLLDQRLPLRDYYDPNPHAEDKTYSSSAAYIDGFEFDWRSRRIPQQTVESTDVVHWLALEVALQAMQDAGYDASTLPRERTGVMLGNTLTGERQRATIMRARWPVIERCLRGASSSRGLSAILTEELIEASRINFQSLFPPFDEDTLAGSLSNTIAGRICNFLDLHGGGYVVDGACASSLLAIITAANALRAGDVDVAFAGGVDISLDTFELIGFAKAGALSADDMRVYDRDAKGFLPGEGCGFVVLKRLSEARAAGDRVYALLRGWGISSDGKGGITAPAVSGQALALQRAYERAGYSPHSLDFVEGHGTGTRLGDHVELEGIAQALSYFGEPALRSCGVTSFKSLVGHTKAAAGIGGFIKTVMAVNRRVLPPTAGCDEPREVFDEKARCLYPVRFGEVRAAETTMRAGVSAMGFGGINSHVTVESGDAPAWHLQTALDERQLMASHQSSEVFLWSASSLAALRQQLRDTQTAAQGMSVGELVDLSALCLSQVDAEAPLRLALVAENPSQLAQSLEAVSDLLASAGESDFATPSKPLALPAWMGGRSPSARAPQARIGMVFPGQGSQRLAMARTLVERFAWARELVEQADAWLKEVDVEPVSTAIWPRMDRAIRRAEQSEWQQRLTRTDIAQPAIALASLLWLRRLQGLGVSPAVVAGHSLGELTAWHAAGAFGAKTLLQLAGVRGRAMARARSEGAMVSLRCSAEQAEVLLSQIDGYLVLANRNSPTQTVASGDSQAIAELVELATAQQVMATTLPVSSAFHSALVADAAEEMRHFRALPQRPESLRVKLLSSVAEAEVSLSTDLRQHFAAQVCAPVDFITVAHGLRSATSIVLEVGPGRVLTGLLQDTLASKALPCLPVESSAGKDQDFNMVLASLFVQGCDLHLQQVHEQRLVRPFVAATERLFITNPCERPLPFAAAQLDAPNASHSVQVTQPLRHDRQSEPVATPSSPSSSATDIEAYLLELVAKQTGFPLDSLDLQLRLLDDLNLDSIKAADFVARAATATGLAGKIDPANFATATLQKVAEALRAAGGVLTAAAPTAATAPLPSRLPPSNSGEFEITQRPSWVRNFAVEWAVESLDEEAPLDAWQGKRFELCYDEGSAGWAADCEHALRNKLAAVTCRSIFEASSQRDEAEGSPTDLLVCLSADEATPQSSQTLRRVIERLRACVDRLPQLATGQPLPRLTLLHRFSATESGPLAWSAEAWAASLHLERPQLHTRCLHIAVELPAAKAVADIANEWQQPSTYRAIRYDAQGNRWLRRPVVQQLASYIERPWQLSPGDLILATGGARGITAACVFELAQRTDASCVLVGSTDLSTASADSVAAHEIQATLERFHTAGLRCAYRHCDLRQVEQVDALIQSVTLEHGRVSLVVHGAGINQPRRVETVSAEAAEAETAPKLLGALNLFAALEAQPPAMFVALTSIIGVTGMPGNAWYAFANQALDLSLQRFQQRHPGMQALSLAYSVWQEIGMGARLGSVEQLAKKGIDAIPVEEGVQRFVRLVLHDPGVREVVVTSRLADLPTWQPKLPALPKASRFLEDIRALHPGVEIVARTHLSLERDDYLKDHVYKGSHLFPTVFGLEAMAQAVAHVLGRNTLLPVTVENLRLERPIVVDPEEGLNIEIHALVIGNSKDTENKGIHICCSIYSQNTGFIPEHFMAEFYLKEFAIKQNVDKEIADLPQGIDASFLYDDLLFHGPKFQRLEQILSSNYDSCNFRIKVKEEQNYLLGDPFYRDALLQSAQLCVYPDLCLPYNIDLWKINKVDLSCKSTEVYTGSTTVQKSFDEGYVLDIASSSKKKHCIEQLIGCKVRVLDRKVIENKDDLNIFDSVLSEQLIRHKLQEIAANLSICLPEIGFEKIPGLGLMDLQSRHKVEMSLLKRVATRALAAKHPNLMHKELVPAVEISWLPSGQPIILNHPIMGISLSHEKDFCLSVAGSGAQGCDVISVTTLPLQHWQTILGTVGYTVFNTLLNKGIRVEHAGSLVWSAYESFKKATGLKWMSLKLEELSGNAILCSATSGGYKERIWSVFLDVCTENKKCCLAIAAVENKSIFMSRDSMEDKLCSVRSLKA